MLLDNNLLEVFEIAYKANPKLVDYYLRKVASQMPIEIIDEQVFKGHNEYETDEIITNIYQNKEKSKLEWFLARISGTC